MNTLKPALRHLRKYPAFSLINLGGLSIGIAASFVLLVYTQRELSTDRQFRECHRTMKQERPVDDIAQAIRKTPRRPVDVNVGVQQQHQ